MGELKLFFPCPVKNCCHNTTNGLKAAHSLKKRATEPCILPATFKPEISESNSKKPKPNETTSKNSIKNLKTKESPENNIALNNPFSALNIEENSLEVADLGPNQGENRPKRKVKLIMLRYKTNYNLVLKELNEKYPNSVNKLIGEYIRITPISEDPHREITATLKSNGEEF
ncbi:hypothetical protein TNCT_229921 [Trichonephila clavata]|uniref:Uncharacterized protein n=1 Tax=Trichonephila clavata TaxID=2740835 RepID=A0A8X6KJW5_TRICU|nr:hypothetical protein TNCT_229921 [Trichonephila clavata]